VALVVSACGSAAAAGPRIEITIHYSHFEPSMVTVPPGRPVTFVLHNEDPIDHEWILGDAALHDRHRTGTEAVHASIPSEISIPALSDRVTTLTFEAPRSDLSYVCHLPGHEAYGMVGTLVVASG
jgi:uncharacterized cupredoxin-like copper-binding protein